MKISPEDCWFSWGCWLCIVQLHVYECSLIPRRVPRKAPTKNVTVAAGMHESLWSTEQSPSVRIKHAELRIK